MFRDIEIACTIKQTDDAMGIVHRGHFRIGDDDGRVGVAHGAVPTPWL